MRIKSEFAQYDSRGRLTCRLCRIKVTSSADAWDAHLISKSHRKLTGEPDGTIANLKRQPEEAIESQMDVVEVQLTNKRPKLEDQEPHKVDEEIAEVAGETSPPTQDSKEGSQLSQKLEGAALPIGFFDNDASRPLDDQIAEFMNELQQDAATLIENDSVPDPIEEYVSQHFAERENEEISAQQDFQNRLQALQRCHREFVHVEPTPISVSRDSLYTINEENHGHQDSLDGNETADENSGQDVGNDDEWRFR